MFYICKMSCVTLKHNELNICLVMLSCNTKLKIPFHMSKCPPLKNNIVHLKSISFWEKGINSAIESAWIITLGIFRSFTTQCCSSCCSYNWMPDKHYMILPKILKKLIILVISKNKVSVRQTMLSNSEALTGSQRPV